MQDLKDEGNLLFKEEKFLDAWKHYCFALFAARQLERTFYCHVEKEFLATLFCNASLCSLKTVSSIVLILKLCQYQKIFTVGAQGGEGVGCEKKGGGAESPL